jgi:hypothetical protein
MSVSERESTIRAAMTTYFPMFIAVLSLITSIYNGYLNNKFVNIIQGNLGRAEHMRTCKDIIDAYFQVKFRAGLINESAERAMPAAATAEQREAINAVNKFAALGTYLANLRDTAARERYTSLSDELAKIVDRARRTPPAEFAKLFETSDRMFDQMNDDCVKSAKSAM